VSLIFFAVGSAVAAVAKDFTYMLVGRSIQGIGGGGILVLGEIIVTDLVPLAVRGGMFVLPCCDEILMASSMVWLSWCYVGTWERCWPTHGWCVCSKRHLEMDFLDQSPNHWSRRCRYGSFLEARQTAWKHNCKSQEFRLVRKCSFHCKRGIILDSCDMG
jgi:hypothetical protein